MPLDFDVETPKPQLFNTFVTSRSDKCFLNLATDNGWSCWLIILGLKRKKRIGVILIQFYYLNMFRSGMHLVFYCTRTFVSTKPSSRSYAHKKYPFFCLQRGCVCQPSLWVPSICVTVQTPPWVLDIYWTYFYTTHTHTHSYTHTLEHIWVFCSSPTKQANVCVRVYPLWSLCVSPTAKQSAMDSTFHYTFTQHWTAWQHCGFWMFLQRIFTLMEKLYSVVVFFLSNWNITNRVEAYQTSVWYGYWVLSTQGWSII